MDTTVQKLEERIAELENQLKNLGSQRQKVDINPEEMSIFKKVGNQLGYDIIDECGINECRPVIRLKHSHHHEQIPIEILKCYECSCGPCNYFDYRNLALLGLDRFRTMGR